jgi:hypothetical protein
MATQRWTALLQRSSHTPTAAGVVRGRGRGPLTPCCCPSLLEKGAGRHGLNGYSAGARAGRRRARKMPWVERVPHVIGSGEQLSPFHAASRRAKRCDRRLRSCTHLLPRSAPALIAVHSTCSTLPAIRSALKSPPARTLSCAMGTLDCEACES